MAKSFTKAEWNKLHNLMTRKAAEYGLPERRSGSVVLASFNIRKLAAINKKSAGAWRMLRRICERFDLVAIQEVQDDLSGLQELKRKMGTKYGMVASDITGATPGSASPTERLAFLFRWDRIKRTEVASDITYDRSAVVNTIYDWRSAFWSRFKEFSAKTNAWEREKAKRKRQGKRAPAKPVVHLPKFVTFIRQPLCVSFEIPGARGAKPYSFLAVNAHLLYGKYPDERQFEFQALVGWLVGRAKSASRMYHPNIIMLGDCNLDFEKVKLRRTQIDAFLKSINASDLAAKKSAKLNFPFLSVHPDQSAVFRTNARRTQTYDQIGLVIHDKRMPTSAKNKTAGKAKDGFDYGVFDFVRLFADALGKTPATLYAKFEHDLTDHMPIWIRLPRPK